MSDKGKVSSYRFVVLAMYMLLSIVIQIQWLSHAAVARPAQVYYAGQFNPNSFFNIDFLALVYMLVYLVMSFPASYIIDKYGIKVGLTIGATLAGIFGLLKGILGYNFLWVAISQTMLAIAQPFILNAVTALTVRWFPLKERALAAGFSALAQYLGIIIAMIVTPLMVGSNPAKPDYGTGFQHMLMVYGITTFVVSVLAIILIKDHPENYVEVKHKVRNSYFSGIKHILKQRDMQITLLLFFIGLGMFNAISSMTDAIAEYIGVADSNGLIGGLMLVGGIIGAVIIPALSDKYRKRKAFLVLCIIGMLPGIIGLTFAKQLTPDAHTAYILTLVSSFILGFFVMSAGPIGFQYSAEINYPAPESASQGMLLWIGQISGMIFVAGMSMKQNRFLPDFMIAFVIMSIITVFLVLFLKESPMILSEEQIYSNE
jgi:MFS family permease